MKKILSLILCLAMLSLSGIATAEGLTDGTYAAASMGKNGDVNVSVTIEGGIITGVEVGEHMDDLEVCQAAIDTIPGAIVDSQSVAVDVVAGATLTSTAIIEAVKLCIEQAGGSAEDYMTAVEKAPAEAEEYEADVVVVGAGASGAPAALSAIQSGASVIVVEKAGMVGGSGMMSMGMGAVGSSLQEGKADFTVSQWLTDWLKQQNYMVSAPMIYKYISQSGDTVDWLVENGADITFLGHAQEALADNPIATYHTWGDGGYGAVAQTLIGKVEEAGGTVLLQTAGKEVLMENGAVAGLRAEKSDGTPVVIKARAVILCTGGYGADADAMVALLGQKVNGINTGAQTGDGIAMGQAVGAQLDGEENVE